MKFSNQSFYFIGITILFVLFSCEPVTLSNQSLDTEQEISNDDENKNPSSKIPVWAGGVPGFESFTKGDNSIKFRQKGGKLHVHHVAWVTKLATKADKDKVLQHFGNDGLFLEIGYTGMATGEKSWPQRYKKLYGKNQYWKPFAITSNFQAKKNKPTVKSWKYFVNEMKKESGVSRIYPTLEYQNFSEHRNNKDLLINNYVSKRKDFQDMIKHSKGLTIDVPPTLFFDNDRVVKEYRYFVQNAIKWTKSNACNNCEVYLILSANTSAETFSPDCLKMYKHLKNNNALPHGFIVNNYTKGHAGPESKKHSALHAGINLLNIINN